MSLHANRDNGSKVTRLIVCQHCRNEMGVVQMPPSRDGYVKCPFCDLHNVGSKPGERCCRCHMVMVGTGVKQYPIGSASISVPGECKRCVRLREEWRGKARKGDVYFICFKCGTGGYLTGESAAETRNEMGVVKEAGLTIATDGCPNCGRKEGYVIGYGEDKFGIQGS